MGNIPAMRISETCSFAIFIAPVIRTTIDESMVDIPEGCARMSCCQSEQPIEVAHWGVNSRTFFAINLSRKIAWGFSRSGEEFHLPRVAAQCMIRTPLWCMSAATHLACTFVSRHFSLKALVFAKRTRSTLWIGMVIWKSNDCFSFMRVRSCVCSRLRVFVVLAIMCSLCCFDVHWCWHNVIFARCPEFERDVMSNKRVWATKVVFDLER